MLALIVNLNFWQLGCTLKNRYESSIISHHKSNQTSKLFSWRPTARSPFLSLVALGSGCVGGNRLCYGVLRGSIFHDTQLQTSPLWIERQTGLKTLPDAGGKYVRKKLWTAITAQRIRCSSLRHTWLYVTSILLMVWDLKVGLFLKYQKRCIIVTVCGKIQ